MSDKERHSKRKWSAKEYEQLAEMYKDGLSFDEIAKTLKRSVYSISHKVQDLQLSQKYIRSNNPNFKAVYQDYGWCYERYINKGMTHQEMADECGASLRVIQKWCTEKFNLHGRSFRKLKKLNDMQRQIIMFGLLGDGHIDRRENQPLYIESHAEDEKDYLFWKYSFLKDLCNLPPIYYPASYSSFGNGKLYLCKPTYRLSTRIIDDLIPIRSMSRLEILDCFNELVFCLHILDDGSRRDLWQICLAEWTDEEISLYKKICYDRFGLIGHSIMDKRYFEFNAFSSYKIDEMILRNLPNDLDIVHKKILDNPNIKENKKYRFVILDDDTKIGLSTYCKKHSNCDYEATRQAMADLDVDRLHERDLVFKEAA